MYLLFSERLCKLMEQILQNTEQSLPRSYGSILDIYREDVLFLTGAGSWPVSENYRRISKCLVKYFYE